MPLESAVTPCCGRIPELVFGEWQPHHPARRCTEPAVRAAEALDTEVP